jgi:hypothetical protein
MKVARIAWFAIALAASVARSAPDGVIATPEAHRRGVEQTFLTFPEWFLVFSPAEYADFVAGDTPDRFVFWRHIGQFWQSYARVSREIGAHDYPANPGYHVMILVIGLSTTVEYALRSAYETTIGRLAALAAGDARTPEDEFGARVSREYVEFIRVRPWYEFDFAARLISLWRDVPVGGPHPLRKWERRYALTSELGVKALYGALIGAATDSAYEAPLPVTATWMQPLNACAQAAAGIGRPEPQSRDPEVLVLLPRYQAFTASALALADCGVEFREIAGNRSAILVSIIDRTDRPPADGARLLFRQAILTRPGYERRAYVVTVAELAELLRKASRRDAAVEHVFDY